jgi:hypothetical protein
MPALKFINLGSARVNVGSGPLLDDILTGTIIAVCTPTVADTAGGRIYQKAYLGADASYWLLDINDGVSALLRFGYSRSVTDLAVGATVVTLNQRQFFAASFNGSGVAADQKLYRGTDQQPVTEVATYSQRQVGSGTHPTDAGANGYIGNRANFNVGFPGTIEMLAIYRDRILTLTELRDAQAGRLPLAGLVGYWLPGESGQNLVPDLSGNGNHGVVTGATLSPDGQSGRILPSRRLYLDSGGTIAKSGSDSIDFSTLESLPLLDAASSLSDTLALEALESKALDSTSSVVDSLGFAALESTTLTSTVSASDTLGVAAVEGTTDVTTGAAASLIVSLVEGTTVRATRTLSPTASTQEFEFSLTQAERASITSPDIRLRFTAGSTPVQVSSARVRFSTEAGSGEPDPTAKSASDTLAFSVTENSSLDAFDTLISKSAADTLALAFGESAARPGGIRSLFASWLGGAGLLQRAGYRSLLGYWLGGAGLTNDVVSKTASDTLGLGTSDAVGLAGSSSVTDTVGLTVAEGVSLASMLSRADALDFAVVETTDLLKPVTAADTIDLGANEGSTDVSTTTAGPYLLSAEDFVSVGVADTQDSISTLGAADALNLSAIDDRAILVSINVTDTIALSTAESRTLLSLVQVSDALSVAAVEGLPTVLVSLNRADSADLMVTEGVGLFAASSRADVLALAAGEAAVRDIFTTETFNALFFAGD